MASTYMYIIVSYWYIYLVLIFTWHLSLVVVAGVLVHQGGRSILLPLVEERNQLDGVAQRVSWNEVFLLS